MKNRIEISSLHALCAATLVAFNMLSVAFVSLRLFFGIDPLPGAVGGGVVAFFACISVFKIDDSKVVQDLLYFFRNRLNLALAAIFFFSLGLNLYLTPMGSDDAWTNWNVKAYYLAAVGDPFSGLLATYQPNYPLLLPSLTAVWRSVLPLDLQAASAMTTVVYAVVLLLWMFSVVHDAAGALPASLALAGLVLAPVTVDLAAGQLADPPLAVTFAVALMGIFLGKQKDQGALWMYFTLLASLAWIKNEGFLLAGCCVGVKLFVDKASSVPRTLRQAAVPFLLFGVFIVYYKSHVTFSNELTPDGWISAYADNLLNFDRYVASAVSVIVSAFSTCYFGIVFYAIAALLLYATMSGVCLSACKNVFTCLVCVVAGYVVILVAQPNDLVHFLNTFSGRLVFHVYPSLLAATAVAFKTGVGARPCAMEGWVRENDGDALSCPLPLLANVCLASFVVVTVVASWLFIRYNREMYAISVVDSMAQGVEAYKTTHGAYLPSRGEKGDAPAAVQIHPHLVAAMLRKDVPLTAYYSSDGKDYRLFVPFDGSFGFSLLRAKFPGRTEQSAYGLTYVRSSDKSEN